MGQTSIYKSYIEKIKDNYFNNLIDKSDFVLFSKKISIDMSLDNVKRMNVIASFTAVSDCLFANENSPYSKDLYKLIDKIIKFISNEDSYSSEDLSLFIDNLIDKHCDGVESIINSLMLALKSNTEAKRVLEITEDVISLDAFDIEEINKICNQLPLLVYFNEFLKQQRAEIKAASQNTSSSNDEIPNIFKGHTIGGMICAGLANAFIKEILSPSDENESVQPKEDLAELFSDDEIFGFIKELVVLDFMYIFYYVVETIASNGKKIYGLEDTPTDAIDDFLDSFEKAYKLYIVSRANYLNIEFIPNFKGVSKSIRDLSPIKLMEKVILEFPYSKYFYNKYFEMGGKLTENLIIFAAIHMVDLSDMIPQNKDVPIESNSKDIVDLYVSDANDDLLNRLENLQKIKLERQQQEKIRKAEELAAAEEERKLIAERERIKAEERRRNAALERERLAEQERLKAEENKLCEEIAAEERAAAAQRQKELQEKKRIELQQKIEHAESKVLEIFSENLREEKAEFFVNFKDNPVFLSSIDDIPQNHKDIAKRVFRFIQQEYANIDTRLNGEHSVGFSKKLKTVMSMYGAEKVNSDTVLMIFDETLFNSAKDGFVITKDYFLFRSIAFRSEVIPLKNIQSVSFSERSIFVNGSEIQAGLSRLDKKILADIIIYCVCFLLRNKEEKNSECAIAEVWTCTCGSKNPADTKFCGACGNSRPNIDIDWICSGCGTSNLAKSKFCTECGKAK